MVKTFVCSDHDIVRRSFRCQLTRCEVLEGAHKVSDEEIVSIVDYVRNGGDQPTTEELRPFISREVAKRARSAGLIKRKEYPGLCPRCHATKRQFKGGLSSHNTQQFRCGECRRVYQLDYQTARTRQRLSLPSSQYSKHDCRAAPVGS